MLDENYMVFFNLNWTGRALASSLGTSFVCFTRSGGEELGRREGGRGR